MALSKQGEPKHRRVTSSTSADSKHHELPTHELPEKGLGLDDAYEKIASELLLDGQARLNLATFVTTWMPSPASALMAETADKNMIDKDEYPQTAEIEARCVNILADLWNSPRARDDATGCSTTGSSEAAMLARDGAQVALARADAKARQADRPAEPRDGRQTSRSAGRSSAATGTSSRGSCRWRASATTSAPEEAVAHCDENTIGVVAILGSTFDGSYEPVKEIAAALDRLEPDRGLDVPIHVDAASGGFVAPFLQPELEWDFRIERVQSINASGHKYGLVYPGVGWAVWRDEEALPEDLVFDVNYLGGHMPTFALNFSRPGSEVDRAVLHASRASAATATRG